MLNLCSNYVFAFTIILQSIEDTVTKFQKRKEEAVLKTIISVSTFIYYMDKRQSCINKERVEEHVWKNRRLEVLQKFRSQDLNLVIIVINSHFQIFQISESVKYVLIAKNQIQEPLGTYALRQYSSTRKYGRNQFLYIYTRI